MCCPLNLQFLQVALQGTRIPRYANMCEQTFPRASSTMDHRYSCLILIMCQVSAIFFTSSFIKTISLLISIIAFYVTLPVCQQVKINTADSHPPKARYEYLLVMATLAKRKRTKASIMVFSSISKRSEQLRQ